MSAFLPGAVAGGHRHAASFCGPSHIKRHDAIPQKPSPGTYFDSLRNENGETRDTETIKSQLTSMSKERANVSGQSSGARFLPDQPRKGADVVIECLEREGVTDIFAYPGGASMELHQALTRTNKIRNILCRHEQGEVFAAEGYAKATGRVGVCMATSGPGATNLVTGLADAMLDSVPMVAITGQVARKFIGTDAFQETPILEISQAITKHNFCIMHAEEIPKVMRQAFMLARTGRPGPVLVDIPKDLQQQMIVPRFPSIDEVQMPGYQLPAGPTRRDIEKCLKALREAKRPVIYCGGGALNSYRQLRELANALQIPVAQTLLGLGAFPGDDALSLKMLGMHGTVYANYAVNNCDLMLALGVRFDDRVTGKVAEFAKHARIVHVDIDAAELNKNKDAIIPIVSDLKSFLDQLNSALKEYGVRPDYSDWHEELRGWRMQYPMHVPQSSDETIHPQYAVSLLHELTRGEAVVATGVGQHQMFAAQYYPFPHPRNFITSGGLGSMGFGLPSAIGAAVSRPDALVVDIDGDGSFIMNIQELATAHVYDLNVKVLVLNNQHLGMVNQWEDRFYDQNHAHTYIGDPKGEEIYPDFVKIAEGCKVPAARVTKKSDLRAAMEKMLATKGPYVLDVRVPHEEHVLPMVPGGGSFAQTIVK